MASRASLHLQLSSVMETMVRSVLSQVYKLVDEDTSELRSELSRLLVANSALAEKVTSLQGELTALRSDAPKLCESYRSLGVQTVCRSDEEDARVSGPPTIEGIFGKDWCMNLWKERDPNSPERVPDKSQTCEKVRGSTAESLGTALEQITMTDIKEEDFLVNAASSCQWETLSTEEHKDSMTREPEPLLVSYSANDSPCSLPFDQGGEQVASEGVIEESSMQLLSPNDTEEAFITHIIPIDEDEDEDVQFVQERQPEPADGFSLEVEQTLQSDASENSFALDEDSRDDCNILTVETADKFTCQICSRTFFHKGTLTQHMKSHRANFCNICQQHFPHKNKFNSHTCVPPPPCQTVSKSCELCGKTFANPSALRIHYVVHTGEKPHMCSLCGKGFTQKGNLKCHLRIHTGERPFRCVRCGKTFTQKVNLNHHLMAHRNREVVGEKPVRHNNLMAKNGNNKKKSVSN